MSEHKHKALIDDMNPLKTHLKKNGGSACGKIIQRKHLHIPEIFIHAINRCKKCDLIFELDFQNETAKSN